MAGPARILAFTRKPDAGPVPRIPCDWLLTIDLDGIARVHWEFWRRGLFNRMHAGHVARMAKESLSADYFLHSEPSELPSVDLPYAWSARYVDDALGPACQTLLQLGVRARIHLLVERRTRYASFAIATSRPVPHVLGQYFPNLRPIRSREFQKIRRGRRLHPRILTRFTLPEVLGVGSVSPAVVPVPVLGPAGPDSLVLGDVLASPGGRAIGPAHFPLADLTRGTLVAGMIGGGKTNTVMRLVAQVNGKASVLVFDVKREYRCLHKTLGATVYGFLGRNLFTHNLLKPVGPPAVWVKQFSSILSEVINRYVPAVGSKDVVAEELDRLYRERGVYEGNVAYPHIGDLTDALEKRAGESSGREGGWLASALRVLRTLRIGSTRDAFCIREGLSLNRLIEGVAVIELDGIGDKAAESLLASVLVQKIRNHLEPEPPLSTLKHLIVVEEAQHLLAQGQEATSVLTTTCREIRAYGVGLVYVTQIPSELTKHALANVHTIVVHRLVHPNDKSLAANLLGIDKDEGKDLIDRLDVGNALVKSGPVALVRIPAMTRPNVRDDELVLPQVTREDIATSFAGREEVSQRVASLRPQEWEVFVALAEARAVHPSGLREMFPVSQATLSKILRRLMDGGLVRYCPAKKEGRGRARTVYFLTPMGEEAFRARTGRYHDRKVSPSPEHAALVAKVVELLRIERKPHARFDILYDDGGRECAIEVETGSNNDAQLLENLTKSVEFQGEARFVAAEETIANRLLQVTAKHTFDRRGAVVLRMAALGSLPRWDTFTFEPVPITT